MRDWATRQPSSPGLGSRLSKSGFSQTREGGRRLTWEVIMMLESIRKLMAKPREAHAQLSTPQRSRLLRPVHLLCYSAFAPAIWAGLARAYVIKMRPGQPISGRIPRLHSR